MIALSLLAEPFPCEEARIPVATATMISCVENAKATATAHFHAAEIIAAIRSDTHFPLRDPVARIREKFASVMASSDNDRKAAKKAIDEQKKRLPAVMFSGMFHCRRADALTKHSGLLCADLDGLGDRVADVREKVLSSVHLFALFVSPTGDGLKCVFRVPADGERHLDSFRAVEDHVQALCGIQIDESCKDVGRLCFLSHDEAAYLNENTVELPPLVEATPERMVRSFVGDAKLQIRRGIASGLLDEMDWTQPDRGYCLCPGKENHTATDGERDCQVYLDGAPTISCFHNSCRETLDIMNSELRSRIGKAEFADTSGSGAVADKFGGKAVALPFTLPPIIALADFLSVPLEMPPVIVEGMIRERSVVQFSSSSKSYKTWTLLDLGLSVSQGCSWLGRQVAQGRVLFLNFELTEAELQSRLKAISGSKGTKMGAALFDVCNLRGHSRDIGVMMPEIIKHCEGKDYAMIIPDPIYSMMGERNENAANEIADFLNHLSQLSEATGAAVVYTHHYAKGNAAVKEQIDRASGSGVFARHADGIITLTRHEEDNVFVVEAELRSFERPAAFTVKWDYPRMELSDHDPKKLKSKAGAKTRYSVEGVLDCLTDGMATGKWYAAAYLKLAIGQSTFAILKKEAELKGVVEVRGKQWFRSTKTVPFPSVTQEPMPNKAAA